MLVKNDLFDYQNRYIYQDSDFFKFSLDSILLAEYVKIQSDDNVIVDMCAGNMSVPLILSTYTKKNITGFEIQNNIYKLGKKSIEVNKLNEQLNIINDDVKNIGDYFAKEGINILVCNPPYFKYNDEKVININKELSYARHEIAINLEDIFSIAKKYLVNKGSLYLVHRAERVDEIVNLSYKYQVYVKQMQFISTKQGEDPKIVLVQCKKNSKLGVKIKHELCIENVKSYQNIFKEEK